MSTLKKFLVAATCSATMMFTMPASASVVTVGHLSSDTLTKQTTDTTTGRKYTRFDAFDLTYAGTLAAIAPGGAWAGWSIASYTVADDFVSAALGVAATPCTGTGGGACGVISGWSDGKLGASYSQWGDYFVYLMDSNFAATIGISSAGGVTDNLYVGSPLYPDTHQGTNPINYLLYKDPTAAAAVPEPVSPALFGLGLAILGLTLRRKRG